MNELLAGLFCGAWAGYFLGKPWPSWRNDRGLFIGALITAFGPTFVVLLVKVTGDPWIVPTDL